MKLYLLALLPLTVSAQDTTWTRFSVPASGGDTYGYADASGRVRIPARFGGFTNARKFHHIMAVSESKSYKQYHLLKTGQRVGVDSVYVFDYTFDCESEGKIRFKDKRRNRVGFFDARGRVVIPAQYNYVSPFHNGLAVALIGARQTCGSGPDTARCEHPGWRGGRQVLLNARNEVVADLATATASRFRPNWYSLTINAPAADTATTVTLTAANGDRYTFTEYEKDFKAWFFNQFLPAVRGGSAQALTSLCFSEVAVASRPFRGWPHLGPAAFVASYRSVLQARLGAVRRGAPGLSVFVGDLNTYIFTGPAFQPFLTDCGEHFQEKYPVFEVVLTYPAQPANAPIDHQEHYEFIRTASGYRLLSFAR